MPIRPATRDDILNIREIARVCAEKYYPHLTFDKARTASQIRAAISSARHFVWVAEQDGKVAGVLGALAGENFWAQRNNCNVVLWFAMTPGDGAALLREFRRWVDGRPAIKVSGFMVDFDGSDSRVWKLVERTGFTRHGGAYLRYRVNINGST